VKRAFARVLNASELPPGTKKAVDVDGVAVLVCNSNDRIYAVSNICSHAHEKLECGRMSRGWIGCPVHGARFDLVDEFTHQNQVSPRVNLVWQASKDTTLHAGYSHYFTPPPFELVSGNAFRRFTGTTAPLSCPVGAPASAPECRDSTVLPEHDNYYDAGMDHVFLPGLHGAVDAYFKSARDLIDDLRGD